MITWNARTVFGAIGLGQRWQRKRLARIRAWCDYYDVISLQELHGNMEDVRASLASDIKFAWLSTHCEGGCRRRIVYWPA